MPRLLRVTCVMLTVLLLSFNTTFAYEREIKGISGLLDIKRHIFMMGEAMHIWRQVE